MKKIGKGPSSFPLISSLRPEAASPPDIACEMTQGKRVAIVNGIVRYVLPSSKPHADHPSHGLRVFV